MSETVTKTIKMWPQTIDCVEALKTKVHALSFSDAIRAAVDLSSMLIDSIENGKRVIIEDKYGRQKQILINGRANREKQSL